MGSVQVTCCRCDTKELEKAVEAPGEALTDAVPFDTPFEGALSLDTLASDREASSRTSSKENQPLDARALAGGKTAEQDGREGTDGSKSEPESEPEKEQTLQNCDEDSEPSSPGVMIAGFARNMKKRFSVFVFPSQANPEEEQDSITTVGGPAVGHADPKCSRNEISEYEQAVGQQKPKAGAKSGAKDALGKSGKHSKAAAKSAQKHSAKSATKKNTGEVKKKIPGDDVKKKGKDGETKRPAGHKIESDDTQITIVSKAEWWSQHEQKFIDLKSGDVQVRIAACKALASLGPVALQGAGSLADAAIRDDNEKVRVAARGALSALRDASGQTPEEGITKAKDALRENNVGHALSAYHLLNNLGAGKENEEEAAERATEGLRAEDANVRRRSCRLLGKLGDAEHARKVAETAVADTQDDTRREAAIALQSMCDKGVPFPEETMKSLFQEARLKNFQATTNVYSILAGMGQADPYTIEFAKLAAECLEDKERDNRKEACSALGRLGDSAKPHVDALIERASRDKVSEVRSAALTALGELRSSASSAVIEAIVDRAQNDVHTSVQSSANQALGKLQSEGIKLPDKARLLVEEFDEKEKEEETKRLEERKKREKEVKLMLAEAGMHLCAYAEKGKSKKINELVEFGANPDEANSQGLVALKVACEYQRVKAVQALVDARADVNLESKGVTTVTGAIYTALHLAARTGNEEIAKILIAAGANPLIQNSRKQLPSQTAEAKKHMGVAKLLHKLEDEARARGRSPSDTK